MVQSLSIDFTHCYGIKTLKHTFDFGSNKTFSIYASNGSMKTSFARTFMDHINGDDSKERYYDRQSLREISVDSTQDFTGDDFFVIQPFVAKYRSDKMSNLLANEKLGKEFDELSTKIELLQKPLIDTLKKKSGLTGRGNTVSEVVTRIFEKDSILDVLLESKEVLKSNDKPSLNHITYIRIFNEKVLELLNSDNFKSKIEKYIEVYERVIDESSFLQRGFNHANASKIEKSLDSEGYFAAQHLITLKDKNSGDLKNVSGATELKELIEKEIEKVFDNPEIKEQFNEIDKAIQSHRDKTAFREYIVNNKEILLELGDLKKLEFNIWSDYLLEQKDLCFSIIENTEGYLLRLNEIIDLAKKEQETWGRIVSEFKSRFYVPFNLKVGNQTDVILKRERPALKYFIVQDINEPEKEIPEDKLAECLSQGELRANYILNLMFEIEARKITGRKSIIIIDDIADSFDYKNKYAIVQYLKEMADHQNLFLIILTHNFDFYRTIQSRGVVSYASSLITYNKNESLFLKKIRGLRNPFINDWKKDLKEPKKLIASIPFVRNIIEYCKGTSHDDYKKLTSLLHWKPDTQKITVSKLKEIFDRHFDDLNFTPENPDSTVIDIIFEQANECLSQNGEYGLENKIALSIATRIQAEKFVWSVISNKTDLGENPFNKLMNLYRKEIGEDAKSLILEKIALMTSENIHVNSFMYEPLMDLSDHHLKSLYSDALSLIPLKGPIQS